MKNMKSFISGAVLSGIVLCLCLLLFVGTITSKGRDHQLTTTPEQTDITQTPLPTFDFDLPTALPTESVGTCVVRVVSDDSSFELYVELVGDNSLLGCEYLVINKYLDNTNIVEYLPDYPSTCSFYSSKISGSAYSNVPVVAQSFCDGVNK